MHLDDFANLLMNLSRSNENIQEYELIYRKYVESDFDSYLRNSIEIAEKNILNLKKHAIVLLTVCLKPFEKVFEITNESAGLLLNFINYLLEDVTIDFDVVTLSYKAYIIHFKERINEFSSYLYKLSESNNIIHVRRSIELLGMLSHRVNDIVEFCYSFAKRADNEELYILSSEIFASISSNTDINSMIEFAPMFVSNSKYISIVNFEKYITNLNVIYCSQCTFFSSCIFDLILLLVDLLTRGDVPYSVCYSAVLFFIDICSRNCSEIYKLSLRQIIDIVKKILSSNHTNTEIIDEDNYCEIAFMFLYHIINKQKSESILGSLIQSALSMKSSSSISDVTSSLIIIYSVVSAWPIDVTEELAFAVCDFFNSNIPVYKYYAVEIFRESLSKSNPILKPQLLISMLLKHVFDESLEFLHDSYLKCITEAIPKLFDDISNILNDLLTLLFNVNINYRINILENLIVSLSSDIINILETVLQLLVDILKANFTDGVYLFSLLFDNVKDIHLHEDVIDIVKLVATGIREIDYCLDSELSDIPASDKILTLKYFIRISSSSKNEYSNFVSEILEFVLSYISIDVHKIIDNHYDETEYYASGLYLEGMHLLYLRRDIDFIVNGLECARYIILYYPEVIKVSIGQFMEVASKLFFVNRYIVRAASKFFLSIYESNLFTSIEIEKQFELLEEYISHLVCHKHNCIEPFSFIFRRLYEYSNFSTLCFSNICNFYSLLLKDDVKLKIRYDHVKEFMSYLVCESEKHQSNSFILQCFIPDKNILFIHIWTDFAIRYDNSLIDNCVKFIVSVWDSEQVGIMVSWLSSLAKILYYSTLNESLLIQISTKLNSMIEVNQDSLDVEYYAVLSLFIIMKKYSLFFNEREFQSYKYTLESYEDSCQLFEPINSLVKSTYNI